jgi:Flp pilus assembly protein TadD
MLLGDVLDAANQVEPATAEFEAAVKAAPSEPEAHFSLGYLYWKQKRFDEACSEFRAELAHQPQHIQALTYLGDAEMHGGMAAPAEQHLRQALRLNSSIRLAHMDLGILLANGSDSAEAASHFREAIRLDPAKPDGHYRLGKLLRSLGREQEADAEFAKVKALAQQEQQVPLIQVPGHTVP